MKREGSRGFLERRGTFIIRGPAPLVGCARGILVSDPFRERVLALMRRLERAKVAKSFQRHRGS